MLIYRGESAYDGAPVVVLAQPSWNKKTGTMLGTWILREDVLPSEAATFTSGLDRSVCGHCKYRATAGGGRKCYVRVDWDSDVLWRRLHDDEFPDWSEPGHDWQRLVNPTRMPVRIGSYGDPAVVPTAVWERLVQTSDRYTGYTHLWDWPGIEPGLRMYCMASVDTPDERAAAQAAGWRTFYVTSASDADILCPASKEGGRKTTCDKCRLCMGTAIDTRSIWIPAHGPGKALIN